MNITIFGSTGPLGIELIKQALSAGHKVVAYARSADKLIDLKHEQLSVVIGNLSNRSEIERAVTGADAVISALGPKGKAAANELSYGVETIIQSMKKTGGKRLIALSTGSVRDPQDRFDLKYSMLVAMIRTTVNSAYKEIIRSGELVRSSGLDWTLVRVGFLNNGEALPLKVGYYGHGIVGVKISRASIAAFMLEQATSEKYVKQSPAISN